MAFGDNAMDVGDLDVAIARMYQLHPQKAQFHRHGVTGKWLSFRSKQFQGTRFEFNAYMQPMSAIRKSDWATASTGAFPAAQDISSVWLSYDYEDMTLVRGTVKLNILEEKRSESRKTAIHRLSTKLFSELNADFNENVNRMFNQNTAAEMATVAAIYDPDGSAASGSNATAFLQITDAPVGQFQQGMSLSIGASEVVTVQDVVYGSDVDLLGVTTTGVGPGIRVAWVSGGSDLDGVEVGDSITMSGETTGDNMMGLPAWFSKTTNVYFDESGTPIDRDSATYGWSIPHIQTVAEAGSEVEFVMDTHLRPVANILAQMVGARAAGKQKRKNVERDIAFGSSLVALTSPSLLSHVVNEANATQQFTLRMATSMAAAERRTLFGEVGFSGMVYDSPLMGTVAFEADAAAPNYKIRFIEPSSWFTMTLHNGAKNLKWLPGQRLRPVDDFVTTQRPTFYVQGGAYTSLMLVCDQPRANVEITGITDDS